MEHLATLVDYDAVDGQGARDDLDLFIRGMELDGIRGGSDRTFVNGANIDDSAGTNYGIFVTDCTFRTKDGLDQEDTDLRFVTDLRDNVRCVLERCRFVGVRSIQATNFRADFVRCYKNDFSVSGGVDPFQPVRQFNQSAGAPAQKTQSLRVGWQDTPWVQTGPRVNILGFSDFAGQAQSTSATSTIGFNELVDGWVLHPTHDGDLIGFGKWGKFDDANISPSPEAFYIALDQDNSLTNAITAIDLNLPLPGGGVDPASKIVTYQCLCKVKGKIRFALQNSDDDGVLDEITVESSVVSSDYVYTDTTLVTLRAQSFEGGPASVRNAVVVIENVSDSGVDSDVSALQVFWQQAWGGSEAQTDFPLSGGLANAGHARTDLGTPVQQNAYNWAVNALGIKAASRFQLPLLNTASGEDAAGMGWQSPQALDADFEFVDGEMYTDQHMVSVLGRLDANWYQFVQPERFEFNQGGITWDAHRAKNQVFDDSAAYTITLSTTKTLVPLGTIVRVYNLGTNFSHSITVQVGTSTIATVSVAKAAEFLFYVDGSGNGRWIVTQKGVDSGRI